MKIGTGDRKTDNGKKVEWDGKGAWFEDNANCTKDGGGPTCALEMRPGCNTRRNRLQGSGAISRESQSGTHGAPSIPLQWVDTEYVLPEKFATAAAFNSGSLNTTFAARSPMLVQSSHPLSNVIHSSSPSSAQGCKDRRSIIRNAHY